MNGDSFFELSLQLAIILAMTVWLVWLGKQLLWMIRMVS